MYEQSCNDSKVVFLISYAYCRIVSVGGTIVFQAVKWLGGWGAISYYESEENIIMYLKRTVKYFQLLLREVNWYLKQTLLSLSTRKYEIRN